MNKELLSDGAKEPEGLYWFMLFTSGLNVCFRMEKLLFLQMGFGGSNSSNFKVSKNDPIH